MRGRSAAEVMALPVRLHGIQLGRPVEALLDPQDDRLVGFEVLCGDGTQRFMPFAVARILAEEIELHSALTLVDESDTVFYRQRARRLADLDLDDPWIDERGGIHAAAPSL